MSDVPSSDMVKDQSGQSRLYFVDSLRFALVILVVAHHAGQPYGPTGGDWPVTDPANLNWLGSFFAVNAAFFMGLLFLLAGYFVPQSYDRKGSGAFLKGRWQRIGIPLVTLVLFVHIPLVYSVDEESSSFGEFMGNAYANGLQEVYIHLWFLGHLLLYSMIYVVWRRFSDPRGSRGAKPWPVPNHVAIIGFIVVLAVVSWAVRISYPIDEWVPLFGFLATEPAHLPQYVGLFGVGVVAYRGDWLRKLPTSTGMTWLGVGVAAAAALYAMRAFAPNRWNDLVETGGANVGSLIYSTWEAVICAGLCAGLIVLFRERFNGTNRFLAAMAAASMAAYILHWMMVVGLQTGLEGLEWPGLAKFGLVTVVGVILAFGIGHLSQRIPGLRVILGTKPTKRGEPR